MRSANSGLLLHSPRLEVGVRSQYLSHMQFEHESYAHTPHKLRSTLEKLRMATRMGFGNAGERQSSMMDVSLKTSAAKRYILHSGSRAVPRRCAKSIVAIRPMDSWSTVRSSAAVGEALLSPTPTPSSTAREASMPAIEDENAWRES